MTEDFWLINSNRSRVKRFLKDKQNKDKFFEYIFIDSGRILVVLGKEPPLNTFIKEDKLKVNKARDQLKKLISKGWRITKNKLRRLLVTNIVNRVSYINY